MSRHVSCPQCGHEFEVYQWFEEAEKLVADIVGGETTEPGTALHDVIGPDGITYQVKTTGYTRRKKSNRKVWKWDFNAGHVIESDFAVCFAKYNGFIFMFLIDRESGNKHMELNKQGRCTNRLASNISNDSWIWNFYVTRDTFMEKRNHLLAARQLSFEIENA